MNQGPAKMTIINEVIDIKKSLCLMINLI